MPQKRKWLNSVTSYNSGSIHWGLDSAKAPLDEGPDVTFQLRDCYRQIDIDLSFYNEKGRIKMLKKLKIIQDAANDLEQQIRSFTFTKKKDYKSTTKSVRLEDL